MRHLILFILFLYTPLCSQTSPVRFFTGPENITAVAAYNNTLWAATSKGLIKTDLNSGTQHLYPLSGGSILNQRIYCIAIDGSGKVWVGQEKGISVYDGSNWKIHTFSEQGAIRSIAFDRQGSAWLGASWGLIKFNGANSAVIKPYNPKGTVYEIHAIAIDGNNVKWMGTSRGFEKYDDAGGWERIDTMMTGMSLSSVYSVTIDSKGNKWFSYNEFGIVKYDGKNKTYINRQLLKQPLAYGLSLAADKDDNLWIAGTNLVKFDGSTSAVYEHTDIQNLGRNIKCIAIDEKGRKWIGTDRNCASFKDGTFSVIEIMDPVLPSGYIKDFAMGPDGMIWIITDAGLVRYDGLRFKTFTVSTSGLPSNNVNTIAFDRNNVKWIGTPAGLVKLEGNTWTVYNSSNSGLRSESVQAIAFDQKGVMWIGTGDAVISWDGANWNLYNRFNSSFQGGAISIAVDKNNVKWIGTSAYGIFRFDGTSWNRYTSSDFGLPGSPIKKIYIDENNTKWFSAAGLVRYDDKSWYRYDLRNTEIYYDSPLSFSVAGKDSFLLPTGKGVYGYNTLTKRLTPHPANQYLPSKNILEVLSDKKGNLWMGIWYGGIALYYNNSSLALTESRLLEQNFPNPFNAMTQIEYNIPHEADTQIKLYDIIGREVMVLVDEHKMPGYYSVRVNGKNLPSGVYIYTIQAGEYTDSKKLLLLK